MSDSIIHLLNEIRSEERAFEAFVMGYVYGVRDDTTFSDYDEFRSKMRTAFESRVLEDDDE